MRCARVATIGLVVGILGLPVPQAIAAGHGHPLGHPASHGPHGFFHGPHGFPHGPHGFFHGPRGFFHRRPSVVLLTPAPFFPFAYYAPPTYYVPPLTYDAPPPASYAPPPTSYAPPPAYAPSPLYAPPAAAYQPPTTYYQREPEPRVVVYSTGRYELRGDGVTTQYIWVWVPNPPAGPPPESPSEQPPSAPGSKASPSHDAYRWTDEDGVTTWTDRLDRVPERYRAHAQAPR